MSHPIIALLNPSPEQLPAVESRGRDVVVTAGAGTGKTRTLVARYLSLLADGLPLRSIVAITFTKKAAREMRNRIRSTVRRYLERTELSAQEHGRWLDLYSQLDAARIGTIHSLCTEILRSHPAEAAVDPRFEVLEEGQSAILSGQALDEAMAWAANEPGVVSLFALLGEKELRDTAGELIGKRLDAETAFAALPKDLVAHWERFLAAQQEATLQQLRSRPEWLQATVNLRVNVANRPDDALEVQRREVLAAVSTAGTLQECLPALRCLGSINLGRGSAKAWPEGAQQEVKGALSTLRGLWKSHADVLEIELTDQDRAIAQALPFLRRLMEYACARYAALKGERDALDFDDLEAGALELLRKNPAACARWQGEIEALLIDEFQDTNARQRDLIRLLNGGRGRLFLVGDGKQGIYRFRGADVAVFRQEREQIAGRGGHPLALEISYRGHKELTEALNDLLHPLLGEADPNRPWAEPFAPLVPHRVDPGPGLEAPHIELHLALGSKGGGALRRCADAVAGRIAALVRGAANQRGGAVQIYDEEKKGYRALDYGDVAILCRASTSFSAYEDALDEATIPFLTVAGRGFYNRPEIRDLLNALRSLADPTDDLALAGLLRSPALGLSDEAAYHLWQARGERYGQSLWSVLQESCTGLPERDAATRAVDIIAALHEQVGRTPVADLLKGFLDATAYRAALIQAGQMRAARNVSKLLADAHASGIVGVGEFLEYITGLRDTGAREGEARATAEGAVQVMSVHAAKGLEFPIVVIGDLGYTGRGGGALLVDPELGVFLGKKDADEALPAAYTLARRRADDQEGAESDRLFYVAATRARERLILSGTLKLIKNGGPGKADGWLGRLAAPPILDLGTNWPDCCPDGDQAVRTELQVGAARVALSVYEPNWSAPALAGTLAPLEQERSEALPALLGRVQPIQGVVDDATVEQERIPPQRVWRVVPSVERPTAPAWVVGALVHEALAAWRFPGSEEMERWTEARARGYGLTDRRQLRDAVHQAARLLRTLQAHSLYREMNHAERRLTEVPYSLLREDGTLESGRLDTLYLREGRWTVVEWKTDDIYSEKRLNEILEQEDYLAQAERYAVAVERLLGQRPRVVLCMLNYMGGVRVKEL